MAGGRSRRMGRDKALLPWRGATLLDHALHRLRQVCGRVFILCGPDRRYEQRGLPVIVDAVADAGPLSGLAAGLGALGDEPGLFLAVDLPHVPVPLLGSLLEWSAGYDAVVPVSAAGPEPLCAVYTRTCLEPAARRLAAGDLKMTSFWPDVRVLEIAAPELRPFGETHAVFRNLNEPSDFDAD
jgi:molybdopterin-guanine dinucleotide biosynthesis protein A